MKNDRFFFSYSEKLSFFLIEVKGLKYITHARRMDNDKEFFLFEVTNKLESALEEYQAIKNKNNFVRWEDLRKLAK
ncbi:hypothetical protein QUF73_24845 [Cytobacillus sp. NJ13]|nr:hypothetical protein [Cytobacillus sp. NJ13]